MFVVLFICVCSSGMNPHPKRNGLWAILLIREMYERLDYLLLESCRVQLQLQSYTPKPDNQGVT